MNSASGMLDFLNNSNAEDTKVPKLLHLESPCLCGDIRVLRVEYSIPQFYLNGAHAEGVINMFSCITRNSLVAGGHPSTVFVASARSRSRSPASL